MTPAATLFIIDPAAIPGDTSRYVLSADEQARAARFVFPKDASRWSACRAAVRLILGHALGIAPAHVPILVPPSGKPSLAPPFQPLHFNLSHGGGLSILGLSSVSPLGIDLEPLSRAATLAGCEETFCHPEEIAALPVAEDARAHALLHLWVAKEAVLKSLGTGLLHPPETLLISPAADGFRASTSPPLLPGLATQRIRPIHHPALAAHLAMVSSAAPGDVEIHTFTPTG